MSTGWITVHMREMGLFPAKMPDRYIVEMFIDRIAASKITIKKKYTDGDPLKYYLSGNPGNFMHKETKRKLEKLLHICWRNGEAYTMQYIRKKSPSGARKQKSKK